MRDRAAPAGPQGDPKRGPKVPANAPTAELSASALGCGADPLWIIQRTTASRVCTTPRLGSMQTFCRDMSVTMRRSRVDHLFPRSTHDPLTRRAPHVRRVRKRACRAMRRRVRGAVASHEHHAMRNTSPRRHSRLRRSSLGRARTTWRADALAPCRLASTAQRSKSSAWMVLPSGTPSTECADWGRRHHEVGMALAGLHDFAGGALCECSLPWQMQRIHRLRRLRTPGAKRCEGRLWRSAPLGAESKRRCPTAQARRS